MATYPMTYVSRASRVVPEKGIRAKVTEAGNLKFRDDRGTTLYRLQIVHEWISQAQLDAILSFLDTNGYSGHDVIDLQGYDYVVTVVNEPTIVDHRGSLYTVETQAIGVKA